MIITSKSEYVLKSEAVYAVNEAKKEFAKELYSFWKNGGAVLKMIDLLEKTMKEVD